MLVFPLGAGTSRHWADWAASAGVGFNSLSSRTDMSGLTLQLAEKQMALQSCPFLSADRRRTSGCPVPLFHLPQVRKVQQGLPSASQPPAPFQHTPSLGSLRPQRFQHFASKTPLPGCSNPWSPGWAQARCPNRTSASKDQGRHEAQWHPAPA